ncbi:MAG: transporter [Alphaproteobacteria bacterium]|nr:transporter [Alphaproteobacteria bacterium]
MLNEAPELLAAETPARTPAPDGLPAPHRYWSALAVWLGIVMMVFDTSLITVSLPTIARGFGVDAASATWIMSANQVAAAIALLPAARLGEVLGYRRVYLIGVVGFMLSSIGCMLATDLTSLAVARFVQGLGGGTIMALNGALVRHTYPHSELGRGVSYNAFVIGVFSAIGPLAAGAILSIASWQWLFASSLPLGMLCVAVGLRTLPHVTPTGSRFEYRVALLTAVTFAAIFLACSGLAHGNASLLTVLEAVIGLIAGIVLVRHQKLQLRPFLPIDLIRIPVLKLSYATSICSFAAQIGAFITLPFYLHDRFGYDLLEIGLLMTPWPAAVAVAAALAGRLIERFPAPVMGGVGLSLAAVGLLLLATLSGHPSAFEIGWRMAVTGFGFGFFQTPNNRLMLGSAPRERSGSAGAMIAISRLTGQTAGAVGVALLFRVTASSSAIALFLAAALAAGAALLSMRRLSY